MLNRIRIIRHEAVPKTAASRPALRTAGDVKRKGQAFDTPGPDLPPKWAGYFSEVEMLLKLVLS